MPASQAEKDNINIGASMNDVFCSWIGHMDRAI